MTAQENPPQRDHRLKEARKLFGFALQQDAITTYDNAEKPTLGSLAYTIKDYVAARYSHAFNSESDALDLLLWGIAEASRLIQPTLDLHPAIDKQGALSMATHTDTVQSHGIAASFPQNQSDIIYQYPGTTFGLSPSGHAIWIIDPSIAPPQNQGCPVVHYNGESLHVEPIFRHFTQWAGELAVEAYFSHPRRRTGGDQTLF